MTDVAEDQPPEVEPQATVPPALAYVAADQPIASAWGNQVADLVNLLRNPAVCRAYSTVNVSIPHNVETYLPFNTESFDSELIHDPAVTPSRFTCKTAGVYVFIGGVEWAANPTGRRTIELMVNRSVFYNLQDSLVNSGSAVTHQTVSDIIKLAVNDYVELKCYQDSGIALNVQAFGFTPSLSAARVGIG